MRKPARASQLERISNTDANQDVEMPEHHSDNEGMEDTSEEWKRIPREELG